MACPFLEDVLDEEALILRLGPNPPGQIRSKNTAPDGAKPCSHCTTDGLCYIEMVCNHSATYVSPSLATEDPSGEHEGDYVNRKSFHSINVQRQSDLAQCMTPESFRLVQFTSDFHKVSHTFYLYCKHLGHHECVSTFFGVLLGDKGYACESFLSTPLADPQTPSQQAYNHAHNKTRARIEMTFGLLKSRFQCLHHLTVSPDRACEVIAACAVVLQYKMAERRGRRNILQTLNDRIMFVVDLIRDALTSPTQRHNAISPEMKVITTLRYLATGKMQQCSSDDLGLSQPSISNVIKQTLTALSQPHIVTQFVSFPLDIHTLQAHKRAFMDIAGFPGVVGVIDGTHARIIAPSEDEAVFVNRKIRISQYQCSTCFQRRL
ncbi:putative nuclease HARBI1 [Merluccius polli]|uniref:Putative nuclease HARBI1 n=1 Tax=Merluccius polli TaxID=89951 RepID=A0AA47M276_MERPO|nr:putative nuclease HARBI1 [Merluccius polli]